MTVDPYAGMDADTIARCKASDANLAGIIAGRRRATMAVLASDPAPARAVRAAWEPIRQSLVGLTPVPPYTWPELNPPPMADFDWATGAGPPDDDVDPDAELYLDEETGDWYERSHGGD